MSNAPPIMAPAPQPSRTPTGPPRTPTSIPISEPLAVPARPTLSALSGMAQLALRRALDDGCGLQIDATLSVALLQHAQRLIRLARLREPNDHHVLLSHCHSFRSNISDDRTLLLVDAKPVPHRGVSLPPTPR